MELGNESLYRIYRPSFLVEVDSQRGEEKRSDFFETDYSTLRSITQELENAIQSSWEVSCADFRYLMKYVGGPELEEETTVMASAGSGAETTVRLILCQRASDSHSFFVSCRVSIII